MSKALETVLLVGLFPGECDEIERLTASNRMAETLRIGSMDLNKAILADRDVCLVVLRGEDTMAHTRREVRDARARFDTAVPILVLLPQEGADWIVPVLRAGADDYWILPLDDNYFPYHLMVLLECGEAVLHAETAVCRDLESAECKTARKGDAEFADDAAGAPSSGGIVIREKATRETDDAGRGGTDGARKAGLGNTLWQSIRDGFREGMSLFSYGKEIRESRLAPIAYHWERLERLGKGSFGEVWRVRRIGGRRLAVAKVPGSRGSNSTVLRAAAILKRLRRHPNIVRLLEVLKDGESVVLVQEYLEGPTLQALLEEGLSPVRKESFVRQLLACVEYAHLHRVMHRDIKPENIIITAGDLLKLIDFGIARSSAVRGGGGGSVGTYPFMPPEQIHGKSCIASDVWALGVLLYLLAAGRLPFYHRNDVVLMELILETAPIPPGVLAPRIPEALERIILRCLEKEVEKRYRHAGELREDLMSAFPDFGEGVCLTDRGSRGPTPPEGDDGQTGR